MPVKEVKRRGGSLRVRTIKPSKNTYKRCHIVPKAGKRGGHTVCGPTRRVKKKA